MHPYLEYVMSNYQRIVLAACLALAAGGIAPAAAQLSTSSFNFTSSGTSLTGASPNGTYSSPGDMPAFCVGPNDDNCVSSGVFSSISFADVNPSLGTVTFSFSGSTDFTATPFTITLGNFSGGSQVTNVTYASGTLDAGSFGLTSWNGTTATFTGTPDSTTFPGYPYYDAFSGSNIVFNVELAPNSVPEPASLAVLGVALAGIGLARRRRAA